MQATAAYLIMILFHRIHDAYVNMERNLENLCQEHPDVFKVMFHFRVLKVSCVS